MITWARVIVLALTWLAFVGRVWSLGAASLSFDEAVDLHYGAMPIAEMLATLATRSIHPPLQYLWMHPLVTLAGTSEFAARFVSLIPSVLVVPLTFVLLREVFAGRRDAASATLAAGAPAAALAAGSPFLLYYAQETRMYSLAVGLATLAVVLFLRAIRLGGGWRWAGHALALAGMVYTQYLSLFLAPAFLIGALVGGRETTRRWLLAAGGAALLYLPWLPSLASQVVALWRSPDYHPDRLSATGVLADILSGFLGSERHLVAWSVLALLLVGLAWTVAWAWQREAALARRLLVVLLAALLPAVAIAILASLMPKFAARYAIVAAPAVYVGLAALLYLWLWERGRLPRLAYAGVAVAALLVVARSGWDAARSPWYPQEDARRMAAYLTERARPDDVILFIENAPNAIEYYYRGQTPRLGMQIRFDFEHGAQQLNDFLATKPERVWLVLWHHEFADPTAMAITEFTRRSRQPPFVRNNINGYSLMRFELEDWSPVAATPTPQQVLDARFEDALTLVGADHLDLGPDALRWILYWRADRELDRDYSIALQLRGSDGQVRLTHNQSPSTPYLLTRNFPVGKTLRGLTEVEAPKDLPPDVYDVDVVVWDPRDQRNLSVVDEQGQARGIRAPLGRIEVTPAMLAR